MFDLNKLVDEVLRSKRLANYSLTLLFWYLRDERKSLSERDMRETTK